MRLLSFAFLLVSLIACKPNQSSHQKTWPTPSFSRFELDKKDQNVVDKINATSWKKIMQNQMSENDYWPLEQNPNLEHARVVINQGKELKVYYVEENFTLGRFLQTLDSKVEFDEVGEIKKFNQISNTLNLPLDMKWWKLNRDLSKWIFNGDYNAETILEGGKVYVVNQFKPSTVECNSFLGTTPLTLTYKHFKPGHLEIELDSLHIGQCLILSFEGSYFDRISGPGEINGFRLSDMLLREEEIPVELNKLNLEFEISNRVFTTSDFVIKSTKRFQDQLQVTIQLTHPSLSEFEHLKFKMIENEKGITLGKDLTPYFHGVFQILSLGF